jgi:hypothetical protein
MAVKVGVGLTYDWEGYATSSLGHHPLDGHTGDVCLVLIGHIPQYVQHPPPHLLPPEPLYHVPVQPQAGSVQIQNPIWGPAYKPTDSS